MQDHPFFPPGPGLTLQAVADLVGGRPVGAFEPDDRVTGLSPLQSARVSDVAFFDNPRYAGDLASSAAGVVLISERQLKFLAETRAALVVKDVQAAFVKVGQALFPDALMPRAVTREGLSDRAEIDPTARLEDGVTVEAFAVVGPGAEIGRGTIVGPGASIGLGCRIGRDCRIGAQATVAHSYLGNRVILHPGVRLGQDGFGYAPGPSGLMKAVQIGRVIVQDDVEIGANTTVDRGAIRDTVIGEGTKIDNQVQIAHNVAIGRHCVIVSQVGISGSVTIGDGVMIGGQTGLNGHVTVGAGAQIAAVSSVAGDVPPGARWGGTPARPIKEWFREVTWLAEMARRKRPAGS
ncbi:UDP-3-O-(3-hydroxymyristoyl)glucosamine N-acyltransferase [Aurantimonas sp. Leaf443]|uniref:UDP-3-O-(3-hydroxymyristoyl)glucosamine N-acyltransferase n=1 Tax=Aurantimonas sp. Leaf443 TaxID=1736378 RepID=UPI0006F81B05|nr:UDP-3-O-(3-hydroxymyristoyl)glucosamine N-acyltransferase [Aurantimonas sp. Leaf443]KQT83584.1 UDP-3-O-(3-hydroxymyristoyl)glucosamine N-acyltransferase [Aurantimonas sp. Leaf443]